MLQSSKLLFSTQKLTPNCTTKCSKTQSFCLALKSLHPIAQQNAPKLKALVWHSKAYTQVHNKMLQNSKLLFGTQKLARNNWKCFKAQNPSFKLLQNETRSREKRQKDTIKTQNTVLIIMKKSSEKKKKKNNKMQQKSNNIINSKEKNVKSIYYTLVSFLKIVELGFLSS
jgi:hypothetical protein